MSSIVNTSNVDKTRFTGASEAIYLETNVNEVDDAGAVIKTTKQFVQIGTGFETKTVEDNKDEVERQWIHQNNKHKDVIGSTLNVTLEGVADDKDLLTLQLTKMSYDMVYNVNVRVLKIVINNNTYDDVKGFEAMIYPALLSTTSPAHDGNSAKLTIMIMQDGQIEQGWFKLPDNRDDPLLESMFTSGREDATLSINIPQKPVTPITMTKSSTKGSI